MKNIGLLRSNILKILRMCMGYTLYKQLTIIFYGILTLKYSLLRYYRVGNEKIHD